MILGFGSHEREAARTIMAELAASVDPSDERIAKATAHDVEWRYKTAAAANDLLPRGEAPARYARFWASVAVPYAGLALVRVTIQHIAREHALSPDGWAALRSFWVLEVDTLAHGRVMAYEAKHEFPRAAEVAA